jgi:release factor glutamine methyltransferase
MTRTIAELLNDARRQLAGAGFHPSPREALLLLARVLDCSETQVLARADDRASSGQLARFERLLSRRLTGEPIAYLLQEREFYGRPFYVDERVLIPRPETEHLVEAVLQIPLPMAPIILEIGVGSGCLALTLALELAGSRSIATDISLAALSVARRNARRHGLLDRVLLAAADLAAAIDLSGIDLVVSNPPYIGERDAESLSVEIRDFEPRAALFAGLDGELVLRRLIAELRRLRSGTPMLLEIGAGQADATRRWCTDSAFDCVEIRPDYAGHPRVAVLRRR